MLFLFQPVSESSYQRSYITSCSDPEHADLASVIVFSSISLHGCLRGGSGVCDGTAVAVGSHMQGVLTHVNHVNTPCMGVGGKLGTDVCCVWVNEGSQEEERTANGPL